MEAIISDSGRQFKVSEGSTIDVDYRELEPGSSIEFDKVLYLSSGSSTPSLGQPFLDGAKVVVRVDMAATCVFRCVNSSISVEDAYVFCKNGEALILC